MTGPFQILDKKILIQTPGHRLLDVAESTKENCTRKMIDVDNWNKSEVRSTVDAFYDLIVTHEKNMHDDWCNRKCGKMLSNS